MAKLRAGLTIELRGSHDHLLPEFVTALKVLPHLPQTLTLCTDDVFPDDLLKAGGLDDVLRRLIRYGLSPDWALRAATLNAAMRLKRDDLGLIAAGRRADIAIFDDLRKPAGAACHCQRSARGKRRQAAGGAGRDRPRRAGRNDEASDIDR